MSDAPVVHATAYAIHVASGLSRNFGGVMWKAACGRSDMLIGEEAFDAGDAQLLMFGKPPVRLITCPRCKVLFDEALEERP